MFLSSGNTVETVEADLKSFGRVLREYIVKKFTGCINYRNVVQGVYVSVSIVGGNIMGCRAMDRGVIYEGTSCSDVAMRYLYHPEGVIEVVEISKKDVLIDLAVFPLSRLEERTALVTSLGSEVAVAPSIPTPVTVTPPSTAKVEEKAPATPVETVPPMPVPPPTVSVGVAEKPPAVEQVKSVEVPPQPPVTPAPAKPKEVSVVNECIDPITLYSIMRSSQIVETVPKSLTLEEIMEKIKGVAQEKKPRYIYVSGSIEDAPLRVIHDLETGNIYIELEKGGAPICGNGALDLLKGKVASSIRIWIVSP